MPTQSASIVVLLTGVECRHVTHYAAGQLLGTLMRHFPSPRLIRALPVSVVAAAEPASLMPLSGLALLHASRRRRAPLRAVKLPPIAAPAQEEDLAAGRAVADGET
jgi:hypothetical protein